MQQLILEAIAVLYPDYVPGRDFALDCSTEPPTLRWQSSGMPTIDELLSAEMQAAVAAERAVKRWTAVEFWDEFTDAEKLAFAKSRNQDDNLLRAWDDLTLSRAKIRADSDRVRAVLALCVARRIITQDRMNHILGAQR